MTQSIVPEDTPLGRELRDAVKCARLLLVCGVPSSGKSLIFQQLAILAHEGGRRVHGLQWDDARHGFETQKWLSIYPDPAPGTTHPAIRKSIGLWVRDGIVRWADENRDATNILLVELPVVGGRLVELLQPKDDAAEGLLASSETIVLTPVPTNAVRRRLEEFRAKTSASPRNSGEAMEAAPSVVQAAWLEARALYDRWYNSSGEPELVQSYDATICSAVFQRLNRHRHSRLLQIDRIYETQGSTYDRSVEVTVLRPTDAEVVTAYARLSLLIAKHGTEGAVDGWADY